MFTFSRAGRDLDPRVGAGHGGEGPGVAARRGLADGAAEAGAGAGAGERPPLARAEQLARPRAAGPRPDVTECWECTSIVDSNISKNYFETFYSISMHFKI